MNSPMSVRSSTSEERSSSVVGGATGISRSTVEMAAVGNGGAGGRRRRHRLCEPTLVVGRSVPIGHGQLFDGPLAVGPGCDHREVTSAPRRSSTAVNGGRGRPEPAAEALLCVVGRDLLVGQPVDAPRLPRPPLRNGGRDRSWRADRGPGGVGPAPGPGEHRAHACAIAVVPGVEQPGDQAPEARSCDVPGDVARPLHPRARRAAR